MIRSTTSRLRTAAISAPGTVHARRSHGVGDVRGYRPWAGLPATTSPIFTPSRSAPWRMLYGGSSRRRNNRDQCRVRFQHPQQNAMPALTALRYNGSHSRVTLNLLSG